MYGHQYPREPAMNVLRLSFLLATDALMIVLLVSLMSGCVTTPSYRKGDFVSHVASTAPSAAPDRPLPAVAATPAASRS
jgi:hypothetical protein